VGEITLEFPRFPPRMPTVYPALTPPMPSPYTIEQTASASGLSVKFIRRMKEALPGLFEKHTERGPSNALLFDEGMIEILKRTRDLRSRGRTLQQIRDDLSALAESSVEEAAADVSPAKVEEGSRTEQRVEVSIALKEAIERENTLLRSQVTLLQTLLQKAEERFDRLLPEGKTQNTKSQLLMWLVEAVVVTAFASGFIFLIWFFAQKAFRL